MFTKMARAVTMRLLALQRLVYATRDVAHALWKLDPKAPEYDRTVRTLILRVDEITSVFDGEIEMESDEDGDMPVVEAWVVHFMEDVEGCNEESIIGPFDSEQQAADWVSRHCTYSEDRKFHIIEINTNPREFDDN